MVMQIHVSDDVLARLETLAAREHISPEQAAENLLRESTEKLSAAQAPKPFRPMTFELGEAKFDVNKALQFAGHLEADEEILRKQAVGEARATPAQRFVQETFPMGVPLVDITKALSLAGELEDAEIVRKMQSSQ